MCLLSIRLRCLCFVLWFVLCVVNLGSAGEPDATALKRNETTGLRIFPQSVHLTNADSFQRVTLQWTSKNSSDESVGSVATTDSSPVIADPAIAKIEMQPASDMLVVRAIASGTTILSWSGKLPSGETATATCQIECKQIDAPKSIEFNNHIQAVMARNGCNMGACHGALAGKGGFRLSLRGYDPVNDHFNITRQDRGRRIELSEPAMSLFLTKPSGAIEHKGGLRLASDSSDYAMLARWIGSGAAGPKESDPKLTRIEILPAMIRLHKGDKQPLIVRAHYSSGRSEDVTQWSKFSSTDESVATVDEFGRATVLGPGEGAINAWFASRIVTARVSVPFSEVTPNELNKMPINNIIDTRVSEQLIALGLDASDRCTDSEFLRRVTLDVTGALPNETQVVAFLTDTAADKRSRWIDGLLESKEYVDFWTYRWSDLLMLNSNLLRADGIKAYYTWIRSHVEKNSHWDVFAREIITARGESLENGATNFYAINQDPESMTENICQSFLGLSIGCAKCHNHPLEKWTNDQYYAMANMFARVRAKGWGGDPRDGDSLRTLSVSDRGDLIQPSRGKPQPPAPLDSSPLEMNSTEDRREALADWLTSPDNPYFTRAIVNRIWAAYMGIGIVNAVDDLRASNPASNPALMKDLGDHLVMHQYDLKELTRLILNSETYQRSSNTTEGNKQDKKYFSHYYPRRLMAEVIDDAISTVSTVPTVFDKVAFLGGDKRPTPFYAKGTKALQLFDSSVDSNFLKTFGRNQRRITCECERSDEPSIIQVLNLNNGDTLNNKLAEKGSVIDQLMDSLPGDPTSQVKSAYLKCLSRYPMETELTSLVKELSSASEEDRRIVVEDMLWSLMTSREFLFNH
jgi:hypothetical protein